MADKEVVAERRGGGGEGYAAQRQAVGKGCTGVVTNAVRQPRRGPVGIEGVGRVVEIRLFLASKAVVATEELLGINVCQIGVAECPLGVGIEFWKCATHKGFRIDRVGKFGADLDKAHRCKHTSYIIYSGKYFQKSQSLCGAYSIYCNIYTCKCYQTRFI